MRFFWNYLKTFFFDLYYMFIVTAKDRAGTENFQVYLSRKIYPEYLKSGNAMTHVKEHALNWCQGKGVDIGAGIWPFPGARGIENSLKENAYSLNCEDESLDFIFSSHLMEHLEHPKKAANEWSRVLRKGGTLFLYQPHPACQMWQPKNLKYHLWIPTSKDLIELFCSMGFEAVTHTDIPDIYFSYYVVLRKT